MIIERKPETGQSRASAVGTERLERKKLTIITNCFLSYQNIMISYQYCTMNIKIKSGTSHM